MSKLRCFLSLRVRGEFVVDDADNCWFAVVIGWEGEEEEVVTIVVVVVVVVGDSCCCIVRGEVC